MKLQADRPTGRPNQQKKKKIMHAILTLRDRTIRLRLINTNHTTTVKNNTKSSQGLPQSYVSLFCFAGPPLGTLSAQNELYSMLGFEPGPQRVSKVNVQRRCPITGIEINIYYQSIS